MLKPDSPFFSAINHRRKPAQSQIWYSKAPLGKNEIGKFMAEAAKRTGLPGNVTNHSVRKTCVARLMDAEVPVNYVAQLSGLKNLKTLDSYKVVLGFEPINKRSKSWPVFHTSYQLDGRNYSSKQNQQFYGYQISNRSNIWPIFWRFHSTHQRMLVHFQHFKQTLWRAHKVKKRMMIVSDDTDSE